MIGSTSEPIVSFEPTSEAVVLDVKFPITVQAGNDPTKTAELLDRNGVMTYNGQTYRSPSGAGKDASGWKSCNGWTYWRFYHPETGAWHTIQELRNK